MMVLAKNNLTFCTRNGIEQSCLWNTAEYCWCVTLFAVVTTFACSVKYEHEEIVEH